MLKYNDPFVYCVKTFDGHIKVICLSPGTACKYRDKLAESTGKLYYVQPIIPEP